MKRLFYVRHGETEMNAGNQWSGQIETPLTPKGRRQARATGQRLRTDFPAIDLIVCSPLSRAHHTAQIIAAEIGYPAAKIELNELLVERSYGALEGTSNLNYFDDNTFESLDGIEGSETVAQMHDRAVAAFESIRSLPQDNVLVVAHGTFGRALRRVVEAVPHTREYDQRHRDSYRLGNAEIMELI